MTVQNAQVCYDAAYNFGYIGEKVDASFLRDDTTIKSYVKKYLEYVLVDSYSYELPKEAKMVSKKEAEVEAKYKDRDSSNALNSFAEDLEGKMQGKVMNDFLYRYEPVSMSANTLKKAVEGRAKESWKELYKKLKKKTKDGGTRTKTFHLKKTGGKWLIYRIDE